MTREVFYERTFERWADTEHPAPEVRDAVLAGLSQLATRDDFHRFCVSYNDPGPAPEHYETRIAGTGVFVEFYVYEQMHAVDVVEIATGTGFG